MTRLDLRLLSLAMLSVGVMLNLGNLSPVALLCVVLSAGLGASSLVSRSPGRPLPAAARTAVVAALALMTLLYPQSAVHPVFRTTCLAIVAAIVIFTVTRRPLLRVVAAGVAVTASVAGLAANFTWGSVANDVFDLQQAAAQALLGGHDPYGPVVPSVQVIAPGVAAPIPLHFPYGPILPLLEAPFRLIGDVRVLHVLAAVVTAVAVLILARRAGTFDVSACLLMAFPLTIGMIIFSWVDIVTMAGLAMWLVLFRSHPRAATIALSLALAAKPTTLIALVPIVFWSVRGRRQVVIAGSLAALVVVPFAAVTGFAQFYHDEIGVFLTVLPRFDSLTVNSLLHTMGLPVLPFAVSALILAGTVVAVLRRRPATYGDLLAGTAVIVSVSFLVAKWAYFNYYYIAAVLLVMAVAGDGLELDVPAMIRPPAPLLRLAAALRHGARRVTRTRPAPQPAA